MKGPALPPPRFDSLSETLAAAGSDEGIIFIDGDEREHRFDWAVLYQRARRAAHALAALGVEPGDRVAIILPTGVEFFDAFFGCAVAGAVPVPLYPPVRLGRLDEYQAATARMISAVGARLVVTERRMRFLLGRALAAATSRPALACAPDLTAGSAELARAPHSLAFIQFSSGTTVSPKPVAIEQRALMAEFAALHALMPHAGSVRQRGVLWLPLYHDMGLVGTLVAAYYPATVALLPPEQFLRRPALWLRAIARHRATLSTAPSFAYALAADRVRDHELEGCDLSSWRIAMNGAEPISLPAARRFLARFSRFGVRNDAMAPVYGLSEATLALTHARFYRPLTTFSVDAARLARTGEAEPGTRELVSVGTPLPGVEVEVRDESGAPRPPRLLGRIFARGPAVMREYYGDARATAAALDGGWLDTGDLGFVHEGELYLAGRAKDVVIVHGANRAPEEFEECAAGVEGVRRGCAVAVGVSDSDGERLVLLVEARDAEPTLEARVRAAVLRRTGVAADVELLSPGALPRTSSGKRRRQEARRRYLAGDLTAPRVNRGRLLVEALRSLVALGRLRWRRAHV